MLRYLLIIVLSFFSLISCKDVNHQKDAENKLSKILYDVETKAKVMGVKATSLALNLSPNASDKEIIKAVSQSHYDARKANLLAEQCIIDKQKSQNNYENFQFDSIFNSLITSELERINNNYTNQSEDPTVLQLLIEIEQLRRLREVSEEQCK